MVEVENLSKVYGQHVAVWKASFKVPKGEILGFLGPNGAGKTTTMRMITGFIPPSSGTARVAGYDVVEQPLEVKRRIGYLCETPPLYREMVVRSYLRFVAAIKRVPPARVRTLVDRAIERCGLGDVAHRVIGHLSKGYRQRVGLAQAILHEPEVLVLDEPTVGLDPRQINEIRNLIRDLAGERTIVLSTHILPEVTMTCSRVVVINEGQVVREDTIGNLIAGMGNTEEVRLRVARDGDAVAERLRRLPDLEKVEILEPNLLRLHLKVGSPVREQVAAEVVEAGAGLLELSPEVASLEEVFLNLVTKEDGAEEAAA